MYGPDVIHTADGMGLELAKILVAACGIEIERVYQISLTLQQAPPQQDSVLSISRHSEDPQGLPEDLQFLIPLEQVRQLPFPQNKDHPFGYMTRVDLSLGTDCIVQYTVWFDGHTEDRFLIGMGDAFKTLRFDPIPPPPIGT